MASMFDPLFPPNWERLLTINPTFGTAAEIDFAKMSDVLTDFANQGRKPYVECFAIRVRYGLSIPNGGAALLYNTKRQRGCEIILSCDQPGMSEKWFQSDTSLSEMWMASQVANLEACTLTREMESERGEVPPGLVSPLDGALSSVGMPDDALFASDTWGDWSGRAVCLNNGGGAIVQAIDDVYPLAPCLASSRPRLDLLPLHAACNNATPWKFKIRVNNPTATGMYPAGTAIDGLATTCTVDVYAYLHPLRADKDAAVLGVQWCHQKGTRAESPMQFEGNRVWRFAGLFPLFDSTDTDATLRYRYKPYSWPAFAALAAKLRWQRKAGSTWRDVFPLLRSANDGPSRARLVDLWNKLAADGWQSGVPRHMVSPLLRPLASTRSSSLISDRIAGMTTFADVNLSGKGYDSLLGASSFAPVFPYAMSGLHRRGLPTFGQTGEDCGPRIQFDTNDRPSDLVTEVFVNDGAFATVEEKDSAPGCGCKSTGKRIFRPALDNDTSGAAAAVMNVVPRIALIDSTGARMANMPPESPISKTAK